MLGYKDREGTILTTKELIGTAENLLPWQEDKTKPCLELEECIRLYSSIIGSLKLSLQYTL